MVEKPLGSWSEYLEEVRCLARSYGDRWPPPVFRGLGDSGWSLKTTLERSYPDERGDQGMSFRDYYFKVAASKGAVEMLTGRRWENVPDYGQFNEILENDPGGLRTILTDRDEIYEYLIYLRHHGFPSPLLDWTASPYVAAFFAFDTVISGADRVGVYAFVESQPSVSSGRQLIPVGPYGRSHPRHLSQQCWYWMCVEMRPLQADYLIHGQDEAMTEAAAPEGKMLKFTIPAAKRLVALKELELMNVNLFSLFGSEDSLVRTVARREFLFRSRKR